MGCSPKDPTYLPDGTVSACQAEAQPAHRVRITKAFEIGKYEVTQAQWEAVMGNNPSFFKGAGHADPVEQVSWEDVHEFLSRLNMRKDGYRYRLPTEADGNTRRERAPKVSMQEHRLRRWPGMEWVARICSKARDRRIRLARKNRTRGVCTTCTATSRSAWRIGTAPTTIKPARKTIRRSGVRSYTRGARRILVQQRELFASCEPLPKRCGAQPPRCRIPLRARTGAVVTRY